MSRLGYQLTTAAEEDVAGILRESRRLFGPIQRDKYTQILERAIRMVTEAPERPGSRDRRDLADGVRSFHLELAAGRRGGRRTASTISADGWTTARTA